ncbi:2-oxoacid:acceptor oxidoreductase family protein [Patescibacteria group bacterium]|nr:2-oxoacid:acceptor oxidoreductase family protein [Patescibacteria group bacterium]MBU1876930.1 2-oxoacid:acceptor oxidoreductase family protein [Patescibacteria group bacterium]
MIKNNFNIIIVGVGGQGLITMTQILAQAALIEGLDIKTSELHGLSQRDGSVETAIRFGSKVFSPLVKQAGANLIIALEMQEALRACYYASKESKTIFLINEFIKTIPGSALVKKDEITKGLQGFSEKIISVPASEICAKELNKEVVSGVYLVSLAALQNLIPIKPSSILKAIKKIIPNKYLELNIKTFNLAKN